MVEKIGDFLVNIGVIKQDQIDEVLRLQQAGDNRPFGEIAVGLGYINEEALKRYVEAMAAWKSQ